MFKTRQTSTYGNVADSFIIHELGIWSSDLHTDFILKDCFFAAVKLTKILIKNFVLDIALEMTQNYFFSFKLFF